MSKLPKPDIWSSIPVRRRQSQTIAWLLQMAGLPARRSISALVGYSGKTGQSFRRNLDG